METVKRRPGIPHEALKHIVEQAGGKVSPLLKGSECWVKLEIGDRVFEAPNNTALLIEVLKSIGG